MVVDNKYKTDGNKYILIIGHLRYVSVTAKIAFDCPIVP